MIKTVMVSLLMKNLAISVKNSLLRRACVSTVFRYVTKTLIAICFSGSSSALITFPLAGMMDTGEINVHENTACQNKLMLETVRHKHFSCGVFGKTGGQINGTTQSQVMGVLQPLHICHKLHNAYS